LSAFDFVTAPRIIFGVDTINQVPEIAASFGQFALLVTGSHPAADQLEIKLHDRQISVVRCKVSGEPDVEMIEAGLKAGRGCDHVIALGGGSVIDAAKAIAGLLTNGGSILDYVEVVGRGQAIQKPACPWIAIPTTAGTGAEVTRNSVISVPEKGVKVSMRSPHLLPRVAVIDPALTYTMPPEITASTGLDALTQLIEPYTSNRRNMMSDTLVESALPRAAQALPKAYKTGDPAAREEMAFASLCSGMSLANSGLGAVHGFAGVIGGRYPIPHGACCAALLPNVVQTNIEALMQREPESLVLQRYATIAGWLTGHSAVQMNHSVQKDLVAWLADLRRDLQINPLSAYGITKEAIPDLVTQAQNASSMKANPIKLTADELTNILLAAL
jgi:alcohol dehydrogenase class IV